MTTNPENDFPGGGAGNPAAELTDRTAQARREAQEEMAKIDRDFAAKAEALNARLDESRGRYENAKLKEEKENRSTGEASRGLGVGMTVAYAIIGIPLFGAGGGWLLDRALGGNAWQPILTVAGAFLGVGFAVFVLNKHNK